MFRVVLLPKAQKTFARVDATLAKKLAGCFQSLETDPLRHPNIKPLTGPLKGLFRFRVGDYRILYQVAVQAKPCTLCVSLTAKRRTNDHLSGQGIASSKSRGCR
jgi:mRNA interferase RelE/StbE